MSTQVDLFYFPMSFYSMKARMYLAEKGVEPQLHVINIRAGENTTADFLLLNPEGKVPVIKADGYSVPDSEAIMKYGEMKFAGPSLEPKDKKDEMWDLHDEIHGLRVDVISFGTIYRPGEIDRSSRPPAFLTRMVRRQVDGDAGEAKLREKMATMPKDLGRCLERKIEENRARMKSVRSDEEYHAALADVERVLDQCEARLTSSGPLFFGEELCIADIDLAVLYLRLRFLGLESRFFTPARSGLARFLETVRQRESFQLVEKESQVPLLMRLGVNPVLLGAAVVFIVSVGIALWRRR